MVEHARAVCGLALSIRRVEMAVWVGTGRRVWQANETARKIADEQAETFACGDERTVVGEPMPGFDRQAN